MKLNHTYSLKEVLDALTNASDNVYEVSKDMKATHEHSRPLTQYSTRGMLTYSRYARITFTRLEKDCHGDDVASGYMETCMFSDGPKVTVNATIHHYMIVSNDNWTEFRIYDSDNNLKYVLTPRV